MSDGGSGMGDGEYWDWTGQACNLSRSTSDGNIFAKTWTRWGSESYRYLEKYQELFRQRKNEYKSLEARICLECSINNKEAKVAGAEWVRERVEEAGATGHRGQVGSPRRCRTIAIILRLILKGESHCRILNRAEPWSHLSFVRIIPAVSLKIGCKRIRVEAGFCHLWLPVWLILIIHNSDGP